MFTTSLAVATVVGFVMSGTVVSQPNWESSYGRALTNSGVQKKPVAVFLASEGMAHLTKDRGLRAEEIKVLNSHYISVLIDTSTDSGRKMADSFGIREGLVISDKSGRIMALRHKGTLDTNQLQRFLTKYAMGTATTTEFSPEAPVSSAPLPVSGQPYNPVAPAVAPQPQPMFNTISSYSSPIFTQPMIGGS
jgi:hypothetical protein